MRRILGHIADIYRTVFLLPSAHKQKRKPLSARKLRQIYALQRTAFLDFIAVIDYLCIDCGNDLVQLGRDTLACVEHNKQVTLCAHGLR